MSVNVMLYVHLVNYFRLTTQTKFIRPDLIHQSIKVNTINLDVGQEHRGKWWSLVEDQTQDNWSCPNPTAWSYGRRQLTSRWSVDSLHTSSDMGQGSSITDIRKNTVKSTPSLLVRFCPHWVIHPPPPCGHPLWMTRDVSLGLGLALETNNNGLALIGQGRWLGLSHCWHFWNVTNCKLRLQKRQ